MTTPLNLLVAGKHVDSRTHGQKAGIKELAASIAAEGLLQALLVRPLADGKFEVVGGNRRLLALQQLSKAKSIAKDAPIETIVKEMTDDQAREASLAENVVRLDLDPVNMFEQFAELAKSQPVSEIAARFGVTEKLVSQRLALGKLHPDIRTALRAGKIRLDHAQAFTITSDQDAQLAAFKGIRWSQYTTPQSIKQELAQEALDLKSGVVKFVGLEAYEAAGGEVVRSLFDADTYVKDSGLIHRLAREKLETEAEKLRADGWSFVVAKIDNDYDEGGDILDGLDPENYATDEEKAALKKADWRKRQTIERAIQERMMADATVKATSGCVVSLNYQGKMEIEYLQTKWEAEKDEADSDDEEQEDGETEAGGEREDDDVREEELDEQAPRVNKAELERLSRTLSDAVRIAFPNSLSVAVCAATATLRVWGESPLDINKGHRSDRTNDDTEKAWGEFFAEALELDQEGQLRALSRALGDTVHIAVPAARFAGHDDPDDIAGLIGAIRPEVFNDAMKKAFDPRAYFTRGTAKMALEALADMGVSPPAKKNKANLAEAAMAHAGSAGYLPPELRTVHYTGPGSKPALQQTAE